MREIKFRAWDGDKFGFFHVGPQSLIWPAPEYFKQKFSGKTEGKPEQVRFTDIEGFQQYTGLKDKNGKEIYEGDVVEVSVLLEKELRTVEFIEGGWCVKTLHKKEFTGGYKPRYLHRHFHDYLETPEDVFFAVIGNIYENPELLTTPKTN